MKYPVHRMDGVVALYTDVRTTGNTDSSALGRNMELEVRSTTTNIYPTNECTVLVFSLNKMLHNLICI